MYTETNSREIDFVLKRNMKKKIYNTLMAISDINQMHQNDTKNDI